MHTPGRNPRIVPLERAQDQPVGGKAEGLARLIRLGLPVPEGFVVIDAEPGALPRGLGQAYAALGETPVAVRSSASGEDAAGSSSAGQYETILRVKGMGALESAVEECLGSLFGERAEAYRRRMEQQDAVWMSVLVQRMVDARAAGVLFTADPLTTRRDRISIDAVRGTGEALVGGRATADHFVATRQGEVVSSDTRGEAVLDEEQIRRLVRGALVAETEWGAPLDMEWAIDRAGEIFWLQARPVTALAGDIDELDAIQGERDVYTRFNIGEMIPGAVCPLTLSTSVRGIDHAIQRMFATSGVRKCVTRDLVSIGIFHGHVFLNLSSMLEFCTSVAGNTPQRLGQTVCGRPVPELGEPAPGSALVRARNGARYARFVLGGRRRLEKLEAGLEAFDIDRADDARAMYGEIDAKLPFLIECYDTHIQVSAVSGVLGGVLQETLARGSDPTTEHDAEVAGLLAQAGGLASGELVRDLERVIDEIASHPDARQRLCACPPDEGLAWLQAGASADAGRAFASFLDRHGHRALVELDMRQQGWADDPESLVRSVRASVRARLAGGAVQRTGARGPDDGEHGPVMRWLIRRTRSAVRSRERTKSLLVLAMHRFKRAYRHLASLLVAEQLLPDVDAIHFLTHEELGRLASGERGLDARALERRRVHAVQQTLEFPEVFTGRPEPLEPPAHARLEERELRGKPVSLGVVEGRACVARSLAEAENIRSGDILIAPHTDIGWTPYFSVISGVATEVGSAFCHGAVIAREYGLPAVVNLTDATRLIHTGDRVRLDAGAGTLRLLEERKE
ncbi:MAG: pyruvate, water dikinase [Deltaproteobacteria bacterium]|nr:pyruvate, water dikinase [Deltaproteobacteria bacterium]